MVHPLPSFTVPYRPLPSRSPAGMRGTASPRAHPGASSPVNFPVRRLVRRFLLPFVLEAPPFAANRRRRLPQRLDQLGAETHARAQEIDEADPATARPAVQLALDELDHPLADYPVAGVALEHEVLGVPLFFTRLFHGSSLRGPAERSIRYGSRGPSRTSRPGRAKNKSPHHVGGTGWGESAKTRGIACFSAVLPCRIDLYLGRLETRASPSRRPSGSSSWSTLQPALVFLLKTKIASPWPHLEQPLRDA